MTDPVIRISPLETAAVAARTLAHYNIGILPVCGEDGKLQGVVTDRDLVTRCLAAGRQPEKTPITQIMTASVQWVEPDMDASAAAHLMGSRQVRRLPVLDRGKLCGMVSLSDLAAFEESAQDAVDALTDITSNIM